MAKTTKFISAPITRPSFVLSIYFPHHSFKDDIQPTALCADCRTVLVKMNPPMLGLLLFLVALIGCQGTQSHHHPLLPSGFLKPRLRDAEEFILALDDDDQTVLVDGNTCNDQRYRQCIDTYADELDLVRIPNDSGQFIQALTNIVQDEGVEGLKKECRAGANLKRCLGTQFDSCISEKYLKSIGVQEADAKVFVTLSVQIAYQCGEGLDTLIQNWPCIQRVERDHRNDFKRCQSDYARKVQQDPSNLCKYTQDMVICMTTPFQRSCPSSVYGVLCHSMQISIITTLPQCSIICVKSSKAVKFSDGRSDTLSSFLARILLENVPTRQFAGFRTEKLSSMGPKCENARFKGCVYKFVKDIGLPSLPTRAKALAAYLNQVIATKRAAGFEQVCNASINMKSCLGNQLESCFSNEYLQKLGIPATDVLIYRMLKAALFSECGTGYEVLHKNIDCVINAAEEQQSEFAQCATSFEQNIKRDPDHVCKYAQDYLSCNTDILQDACGNDVSPVTCAAMRAEVKVPLPTCKNLTCIRVPETIQGRSGYGLLSGGAVLDAFATLGESGSISANRQQAGLIDSDSDEDEDEDQTKCNDKKLGQCLQTYAKQLGLAHFPSDPIEYERALQSLLDKYGKIGFKKICMAGGRLLTCLGGPVQHKACINVDHLVQLGLSKQAALAFVIIDKQFTFECTKGYNVIYNNFDCIITVSKRGVPTFSKCVHAFMEKMRKDPQHKCQYIQELVDCETKPFALNCSRQVGNVICGTFQVTLPVQAPECSIRCSTIFDDDEDEEEDSDESNEEPVVLRWRLEGRRFRWIQTDPEQNADGQNQNDNDDPVADLIAQ